jgi:hypothetical protein
VIAKELWLSLLQLSSLDAVMGQKGPNLRCGRSPASSLWLLITTRLGSKLFLRLFSSSAMRGTRGILGAG